jgi:hypothetical protein
MYMRGTLTPTGTVHVTYLAKPALIELNSRRAREQTRATSRPDVPRWYMAFCVQRSLAAHGSNCRRSPANRSSTGVRLFF